MDKPQPETRVVYDYNACTDYIEATYGIETRDYAGTFKRPTHFERWCDTHGYTEESRDAEGKQRRSSAVWFKEYKAAPDGLAVEPDIPYQDFWLWIVNTYDVSNGEDFTLSREDTEDAEPWVQEIAERYFAEFGEPIDFHVWW